MLDSKLKKNVSLMDFVWFMCVATEITRDKHIGWYRGPYWCIDRLKLWL